jgi:proteasome lid subunit RPN8/RPN11
LVPRPGIPEGSRPAFIRGVIGLPARLRRLWTSGEYYIGEWHFHPFASPTPSETDRRQIAKFAADPALECPHPVMIVVGGDPVANWRLAVVALVDGAIVELVEDAPSTSVVTTASSSQ